MLWTFASICCGLWALGVTTTNDMGARVHVLLIIGAIFASMAFLKHRKLVWQHAHARRPRD